MPFFARQAQYRLQHRYQDSDWENSDDDADHYAADQLVAAVRNAEHRSRNPVLWGMCRVIELSSKMVIVEFSAGHPPYRVTVAGGRVMLIEGDDVMARDLSPQEMDARNSSDSSPGPDLPPIDNRAPRGIRLRNKGSEAD